MNILLIDDDPQCLTSLQTALQLNGFIVYAFQCPKQALLFYNPDTVDVVIADYHLPDQKGTDILSTLRTARHQTPVIIISGDTAPALPPHCLQAGAAAFHRKPLSIEKLITNLEEINNPSPPRCAKSTAPN